MAKLTQAYLSRLRPDGADRLIWDDELPGYGVRIKASGAVSYLIQYRNAGGRSRRFTIGRYGKLTPSEARTHAKRLFAAIADGADPADTKSSKRSAPTVAELADRFLTEYAEVHKKPSSIKEDRRIVAATIKPQLGRLKAADVTRADVSKLHHKQRETPYEANRTLALLSKMFNLAELWGLRPDGSNPCRHVKRFREKKRERFYSGSELQAIGDALATAERERSQTVSVVAAIRLLALTGCRLSEIVSMRWSDIDFEAQTLRLADAKAGARDVALSAPALAVLAALPRDGEYPLHAKDPDKPLSVNAMEKAWIAIRAAAKLENARLHDFRHTVGTYGGQAGFNAFLVRDLLGHKTLAMTGRYVERDADPVRVAMDTVSERIAASMRGGSAEVRRFKKSS